jgi:hypothetical protein
MARPKAKPTPASPPKAKEQAEPAPGPARITIINLKGSQEQADWMIAARRKTHLSKSVIVRLGLTLWAEQNGLPPFPASED